jgi:hypothetical protein
MHGGNWVVLIAGSTGSALRAVRPPNRHITPVSRRDLVYAASATGSLEPSPWPMKWSIAHDRKRRPQPVQHLFLAEGQSHLTDGQPSSAYIFSGLTST